MRRENAVLPARHFESDCRMVAMEWFRQQFLALLHKNLLLSLRRKRATFLYLFSSFFFVLLIFGVDQALQSRRRSSTIYSEVKKPPAVKVLPIAACETAFFMKDPCFDFVWSGNSSPIVANIAAAIRKNNPGRPIPESKVLSFATTKDVDEWLLANPLTCPGALHFQVRRPSTIAYGVQTNSTLKTIRGSFEDPIFKFQIPLQAAAEREIARSLTGDPNIGWNVSFAEFAHPAKVTFSTVGVIGPTFLLAAAMFGFVIQLANLVAEKELKLRQAMAVMGLMDSVYWSTWLVWDVCLTLISTMVLILSGMMFQFNFFLKNSFGVLFFMFFLFQLNMVGFTFLLSTFLNKASSANTVGFVVYLFGFTTQLVTAFGFPYSNSYARQIRIIWSFFPPNLFALGLVSLGKATSSNTSGISWSALRKCAPGIPDCVMTMEQLYYWLIGTFFLWLVLAIYFDNTLPDVNGVRKPWFYFLHVSYWTGKSTERTVDGGSYCKPTALPPPPPVTTMDEDVAAEEEFVKQKEIDPLTPVQVHGLVKTFPGSLQKVGCCNWKRTFPQHAVQGSWFTIERGKLFCLLGANGAGKTTIINCLTGIIPVTAGDAFVYGESIRNMQGMARIRSYMGVCPQFDILWDVLTGREHLRLFASIKGVEPSRIDDNVEEMLSKVKLSQAANARSESYSGGMKRRLSVAIALLGDPKILYLDEPTTGMDPIMRRHVWDIIEHAKKDCAIVLTTHSMEEADVLADRIAIMAKGRLKCIGTSIQLKSKFGTGYKISVSVQKGTQNGTEAKEEEELKRAAVKVFFHKHLNLEPYEETKAYTTFAVPQEKQNLAEFFEELSSETEELGITDTQLGLTTLEEVFLTIARQAELQSAEGRFEQLALGNGTTLMVPVGTQYFPVPGTASEEHPLGMMIEIFWEQDEDGSLCVRDYSELKPIPPAPHSNQ